MPLSKIAQLSHPKSENQFLFGFQKHEYFYLFVAVVDVLLKKQKALDAEYKKVKAEGDTILQQIQAAPMSDLNLMQQWKSLEDKSDLLYLVVLYIV